MEHLDRTLFSADASMCENAVETSYGVFVPDEFTAYFDVRFSAAFPTVTAFGSCLHPQVIANSYQSMLHKIVNIGHTVRAYDDSGKTRDRIIGTVVAVEYPQLANPNLRWQVSKDSIPSVRAVLAIGKQAQGVDRIIGQHQSGRRQWSVSMEMLFSLEDSGFVVKRNVSNTQVYYGQDTPYDIAGLGYQYVAYEKADKDLKDTWDRKKGRICKKYQDNDTYLMQGGLGGKVMYFGIALTDSPAEPAASLDKIMASDNDDEDASLLKPLTSWTESCRNILTSV